MQGFDPQNYMDRKAAQRMARFSQMAVAASGMALTDSGLDLAKEDSFRVGVDMGTGIGGFIRDDERRYLVCDKGTPESPLRADDHPQHGSRLGGDELPPSRAQHAR